jgi:hypothetical protein
MALVSGTEIFSESEWMELAKELSLSQRQAQVVQCLLLGHSDKQIALDLQMSVPTVHPIFSDRKPYLCYAQHRESLRKALQLSLFRETPEHWRHLVGGFLGRFAWQSCLPGKEAVMNLLQELKQYLASQWSIGLFNWIT